VEISGQENNNLFMNKSSKVSPTVPHMATGQKKKSEKTCTAEMKQKPECEKPPKLA
jgi:hypothetical protein